jgi:hypothetical protein
MGDVIDEFDRSEESRGDETSLDTQSGKSY